MSRKPETTFISSVHRHLIGPHVEKMHNSYRSGTADVWYSGDLGDLWIEYKFIERIPRSDRIVPDLTAQQMRWLNDRYDEGRNVAVVLGTPTGGVIYRDKNWSIPVNDTTVKNRLLDRKSIALWIFHQTGATLRCTSQAQFLQPQL